jgi:hypothetical protein
MVGWERPTAARFYRCRPQAGGIHPTFICRFSAGLVRYMRLRASVDLPIVREPGTPLGDADFDRLI